jgi:hypothetical protein
VNHVVEPDDPYEMFPTEYLDVGSAIKRRAAA